MHAGAVWLYVRMPECIFLSICIWQSVPVCVCGFVDR